MVFLGGVTIAMIRDKDNLNYCHVFGLYNPLAFHVDFISYALYWGAHACNPSYSGGSDQDCSLKPAPGK
jgi:hypothetical protein